MTALSRFRPRHPIGALVLALGLVPQAHAATPFQIGTGSCGGCGICLNMNTISSTPIRLAGGCSILGCGATSSRFADLSSLAGMLQVVSASFDGSSCPQNLIARAQWNANGFSTGADVFFTGPPGETTVMTRVRYLVSTAGSGPVKFGLGARFGFQWANELAIPPDVTNFEIVSPLVEISLNFWRICDATIHSSVISGSTCYILHLPLNQPVFDLPPGYTANSPTLGIVDNIWHGLDIVGDWNASTGDVGCFSSMELIHSVTGDLIVENTNATEINFGSATGVTGSISINGNTSAQEINFGSATGPTSSISVNGNTSATEINFGSATGPTSSISVNGNTSAQEINFGSATGSTSSISVTGNGGSGSAFTGSAPLSINFASLATVDGDLNISANTPDTTVALGPLSLVMGDLTLETKTPVLNGTLDLSAAAVAGNIDVKARDADAVLVRTPPPGKSTALAITREQSSIALSLPADTFSRGEVVAIEHLDPALLPPAEAIDHRGNPIRVDPVSEYRFDADGAILTQTATLVQEVKISALNSSQQAAMLSAIDDGRLVLAARGDGKSLYEARETCPAGVRPTVDGCVLLELLDANHAPLPPDPPGVSIAFVRFTCKTSHFSSYAVAIRIGIGDVTEDGLVNIDDLVQVITHWGPCPPPPGSCPSDVFPPPSGDGTVNIDDLVLVLTNWG